MIEVRVELFSPGGDLYAHDAGGGLRHAGMCTPGRRAFRGLRRFRRVAGLELGVERSRPELATRIQDAEPKAVIWASCGLEPKGGGFFIKGLKTDESLAVSGRAGPIEYQPMLKEAFEIVEKPPVPEICGQTAKISGESMQTTTRTSSRAGPRRFGLGRGSAQGYTRGLRAGGSHRPTLCAGHPRPFSKPS